jgi:RNA polymerase sigma factor (sigma-70 family)
VIPISDPCARSVRVVHVDLVGEGISDSLLLAGFGAKDPQLAVAFVRRFQRAVFGTAFRLVSDPAMAEDIAQQAFEHAWRFADSYDVRRGAVRTWLMRIAHNLAVDAIRMRRTIPVDLNEMDRLVVTLTPGPERLALAGEGRAQLRRSLAGLPAEQARAVVMAAVHGMTAREIADIEEIPLGTAKSRIRAGMGKLHSLLQAQDNDYD